MISDDDRLLLERFLEDDLPDDRREVAIQLLERSPEAVAHVADQAVLLTGLRQSLRRRRIRSAIDAVVPTLGRRPGWWRPRNRIMVAFAAVLIVALSIGLMTNRAERNGTVGIMVQILEAQDLEPSGQWRPGSEVVLHTMAIVSGRMLLRLMNGVELQLTGPFQGEFISASEMRLDQGTVVADAGDRGKGFTIHTVNARVVDQGTRFGVSAPDPQRVDVVVFKGQVDVYDPVGAAANPVLSLGEGEAVRMSGSGRPQRLPMVRLGLDTVSLVPQAADAVVTDIHDNRTVDESRRYYGLVRGGMGEDARLYTTGGKRAWHALPGEPFPEQLLGADVICTFSSDRKVRDLQITLLISRPCDLYVLTDAENPTPEWVTRDFIPTDIRLIAGSATPLPMGARVSRFSSDTRNLHHAWKRRITVTGPVVLGPACPPQKASGDLVMYGIVVKALADAP